MCASPSRAGQQAGSKRPKASRLTMQNRLAKDPIHRMNRVMARPSSSTVVTIEVACHAGGRGFESRRSRLSKCLQIGDLCCPYRHGRHRLWPNRSPPPFGKVPANDNFSGNLVTGRTNRSRSSAGLLSSQAMATSSGKTGLLLRQQTLPLSRPVLLWDVAHHHARPKRHVLSVSAYGSPAISSYSISAFLARPPRAGRDWDRTG